MKCLKTNKICAVSNEKCKICKLDDCKEALKILETQEERHAINRIKAQLPESCRKCTILEILDARAEKVY